MGRPRKRQFVEAVIEDQSLDQTQGQDLLSLFPEGFDSYNDGPVAEPYFTNVVQPPLWHFGGHDTVVGPPINFADVDFASGAPQFSTASNPSLTDSESPPPQSAPGPCSCLASMYLSLAAMQSLPSDIVSALKTVRGAAATAASSVWCPQCGSVLLDSPTPPIESFQNIMLLGTILPIIANGYGRLLKMIDEETDAATNAGQMKEFKFQDYGGLCGGQQSIQQAIACAEKDLLFNAVEMPPVQWRTTVRALLKVDIYGHEQEGFKHKGLKDLVSEVEYRQRTRHEMLDAQLAAGSLDQSKLGHGLFYMQTSDGEPRCADEKSRGCLEILKMAKIAIDNLVIA
jgi:hypothetical protein